MLPQYLYYINGKEVTESDYNQHVYNNTYGNTYEVRLKPHGSCPVCFGETKKVVMHTFTFYYCPKCKEDVDYLKNKAKPQQTPLCPMDHGEDQGYDEFYD